MTPFLSIRLILILLRLVFLNNDIFLNILLQPFPPNAASANANALAGWMANAAAASSSVQAGVVSASSLAAPPNQG